MQMACYQVVRMTNAEDATGHLEMLQEMLTYLGYIWNPEYTVTVLPRGLHQERYQAVGRIVGDYPGEPTVHSCMALGSSIEMAVQRAA